MLGDRDDVAQTLYLRTPAKLGRTPPANARVVQGDVMDAETLKAAMAGQDVVYANLFCDMDAQAAVIVAAMKETGVRKLIFVTSLGIYTRFRAGSANGTDARSAPICRPIAGPPTSSRRPAWTTRSCVRPG